MEEPGCIVLFARARNFEYNTCAHASPIPLLSTCIDCQGDQQQHRVGAVAQRPGGSGTYFGDVNATFGAVGVVPGRAAGCHTSSERRIASLTRNQVLTPSKGALHFRSRCLQCLTTAVLLGAAMPMAIDRYQACCACRRRAQRLCTARTCDPCTASLRLALSP